MIPSLSITSALAVGLTLYALLVFSYRVFLHPLRIFPGPIAARLSYIYGGASALAQNTHLKVYQSHLQFGSVVRIAPDRLVFNTVTALREIYQNDRLVKSEAYRAAQHRPGIFNIFTVVDRALHRSKRKLIGQVVSEQSMRAFEPILLQEIETFIKHLFSLSKTGASVDMTPMCRHLSYDTALHLGFGCSLNLQTDSTNRFLPKAISLGDLRINVCMNFPLLMKWRLHQRIADNVPNSLRDRFFKALHTIISARLSQPVHEKHDLCSFMAKAMGKPDRLALVTEAIFFFPAGLWNPILIRQYTPTNYSFETAGETTAAALCALMFYLSRSPQCYKRLAAEIRSMFQSGADIRGGPHLAECKYLRACIDEALRISPPVTGLLWRELAPVEKQIDEDLLVIDGHVIPRGTQVAVSTYSLHHNAEYFPEPFSFRPERWLEDSMYSDATRKIMSDAFAPFSVGSRSCAGKPMAYLEVSLTLAKTLWYFDFEMATGESGNLGGGALTRSGGRNRVDEFQLYDRFSAHHQGPNLVFRPRQTFYDELDNIAQG
ncbi:cytochrome P450 [Nemania serpens]|nr:cytochrome P450 [Nemania serpens]